MVYHDDHSVLAKTARPHLGRELTYSVAQKLSPTGTWLSFTYAWKPLQLSQTFSKTAIQGINTPAPENAAKPHVRTLTLLCGR